MGMCHSCDSTAVATAKLILQDGKLQEFSYPVKVSYVLQRNPSCFICNSDEMDFDDFVSAIGGDEELQPGQLYFALPLSWLKHPLQAEEMAALAVKASSALRKRGSPCGCRRKTAVVPAFSCRREDGARSGDGDGGNADVSLEGRRNGGRGRKGSGRGFAAKLSAIPE
ncbi:hypothetical protein H6P81_021020 [Aristolochia fimbriata]|uniref:Uncharacterized protein n=1 Tax=Aristolochia fimbriata TaxID=158543 RepID=A0AAV7DW16_ARIFI|nr:hypothetical protein H6P81_021020 [Aristolochia fimbriata]